MLAAILMGGCDDGDASGGAGGGGQDFDGQSEPEPPADMSAEPDLSIDMRVVPDAQVDMLAPDAAVPEPCADDDGDGYGRAGRATCPQNAIDCDDSDPDVHPRADEICDGIDNDCDAATDEDLRRGCGQDRGTCQAGVEICAAGAWGECSAVTPEDERCNGFDDDCDGQIDEGVQNACGDCGDVPAEVCDGTDDDCDGSIDEGVLNACGDCGPVPAEVCDGDDDDCDGQVDEGVQNACGDCGVVPEEVCNGADNDCDGQIDEGLLNACGACGPVPAEVCDGDDDDCDGRVDEDACPNGGLGDACRANRECGSGRCDLGPGSANTERCVPQDGTGREGDYCSHPNHCADGDCVGPIGQGACRLQADLGEVCQADAGCASGRCDMDRQRCVPEDGTGVDDDYCTRDAQCANGNCYIAFRGNAGECRPLGQIGDACDGGNGCADGRRCPVLQRRCVPDDREGAPGDYCTSDAQCRTDDCVNGRLGGQCAAGGEVCDGVDNDDDGQVDEGVQNACGDCGPVPDEVCDGLDNDCDGAIDERVLNACGECGAVPDEVCDGDDDDCDGRIDEGVQNACGDCGPVPAEACNRRDDDCDGRTDEGVQNACGDCGPVPAEDCNGRDDDCDGQVDERACVAGEYGDGCVRNQDCLAGRCDRGPNTTNTNRCIPNDGSGRDGDYCTHDNHCRNRNCVGPIGSGECRPLGDIGDACEDNNGCARARRCDARTRRCIPNDGEGGAGAYCTHGNQCQTVICERNACTAHIELGLRCERNEECRSGRCDFGTGTQRCIPNDGTGRDGDYCTHDNHCRNRNCVGRIGQGECRPLGDIGDACEDNNGCAGGRRCDARTLRCIPNDGEGSGGTYCTHPNHCQTVICDNNACAERVDLGDRCRRNEECRSGRCDFGTGTLRCIPNDGTGRQDDYCTHPNHCRPPLTCRQRPGSVQGICDR